MNGKETIICNCLLYTFIFYSAVIRLFCGSFDTNLDQKQFPTIRQKPFEVVTEILIQLEQDNCSDDYVSLARFDWQSLQNKYLCKDGKIYQNNLNSLKDCLKLEDFSLKQMKFFGLNELNSRLTQKFLICGKLESFEYPDNDDQINQYENEIDDQQKVDESHLDAEQNTLNSNDKSNRFLERKITKKPKNSSGCSHKQKACKYQKQVYCLDKNRKCPVSNIKIFQSNLPNSSQSDNQMLQVAQNIFLQIERESEFYQPIVELIVAEENQICSQIQQKDSQKYQEINSNSIQCNFSNEKYRSIFFSEPKTSLSSLLEMNQIPIPNDFKNTLEDFKYNIYSRQNDIDYYNCIQSYEYDQYLDDIHTAKSFSQYHLKFSFFLVVLLILALVGSNPPIQISQIIDPYKLHKYSLLLSLFIYLNILWLIIAIKYQLGEINKQLKIYSSRDCLEPKAINQINMHLFRNQLDIQIGFVIAFTYLPLLVYVSWKLINKFCWMRKVRITPQTPIEMQFLSKKRQAKK
ncbi:transmembrane protein, putative (macronuclear) [Tetrahymena thermophila SB210]|uniref:Transmembrane protein, putative n=1 Tax=Tetrahymena thermophila (strain SB210) TaxID=312017 RepID=Q23FX9_TETTS|nr:transmembrane protein, putative [Tetrahymena thermophila SB210]EAR95481.2 transmembrane protein, putative [Tetrahymena thermophila SB210]|eukprot:XP_001015726.2 transmembrane protein, putative [Tetrahymena thermophila SB210]